MKFPWPSTRPARRSQPRPVELPAVPVEGALSALGAVAIQQVRRTPREGLIARHHYLSYKQPVGEQLKYLVTARDQTDRLLPALRRAGGWSVGLRP